jgi:hypothetical protein
MKTDDGKPHTIAITDVVVGQRHRHDLGNTTLHRMAANDDTYLAALREHAAETRSLLSNRRKPERELLGSNPGSRNRRVGLELLPEGDLEKGA